MKMHCFFGGRFLFRFHAFGGSGAGVWSVSEHAIFLLLVFSIIGHILDGFSIEQW